MDEIFLRPRLAADMARQLLSPTGLDIGLRSGLFLSGLRRTGKTTFLVHDLIPALHERGAVVIYVDLWSDAKANPVNLVREAIRKTLRDLQTHASLVLRRIKGVEVGALGLKFDFNLEKIGKEGGITLAEALTAIVDQSRTDVVLIVDEVQQAITSDEGQHLLLALKAARDAINPRPETPGHFVFIGTGSHRAMVNELSYRRNQAFSGATSTAFPVLGQDYVEFLLKGLEKEGFAPLPGIDVATEAFKTLGCRPEEMLRALRQLVFNSPGANPEAAFPIIANTLRSAAADVELTKVAEMGRLALAIFDRIASTKGDARGIFSAEAAEKYAKEGGHEVRIEEIQPMANELLAANLIMRRGHGIYGVTDPFVQEIWRERQKMQFAGDA
jgi:hypothetical protein